jgi:ABC-type Fe3+-hydroxamate transport system substrate-binding protein
MAHKMRKRPIYVLLAVVSLLLAGCSSSNSSDSSDVSSDLLDYFTESANVSSVKDANLSSCPSATLGEMADAFMTNPSWRDFPSTTGGTVVELTGEISYDGYPADALIQFDLSGGSFEAVYLGINGVDQNRLVLSALLTKMCNATY